MLNWPNDQTLEILTKETTLNKEAKHNMSSSAQQQLDYSIYNLFKYLWQKKVWLIAIPFVISVITAFWTLSIANTYRSETVLSPTEEAVGGGIGNAAGQLGGLASLAGISVGGESTDQVTVALEIMRSRQFLADFVRNLNIKPQLFAATEWDRDTNTLVLNENMYDKATNTWLRVPEHGRPAEPTDLEVHEKFLQMLEIDKDGRSGLVTIALEFYSPVLAKEWLHALVAQVNREMRIRELESTKQNIEYLENQLQKIRDIEMRSVFFQLIQEQTKMLMLAEVRTDFVFSTIDPAFVPELKNAPRRALICIFAGFLSGFLTLSFFIISFLVVPRS